MEMSNVCRWSRPTFCGISCEREWNVCCLCSIQIPTSTCFLSLNQSSPELFQLRAHPELERRARFSCWVAHCKRGDLPRWLAGWLVGRKNVILIPSLAKTCSGLYHQHINSDCGGWEIRKVRHHVVSPDGIVDIYVYVRFGLEAGLGGVWIRFWTWAKHLHINSYHIIRSEFCVLWEKECGGVRVEASKISQKKLPSVHQRFFLRLLLLYICNSVFIVL